MNFEPTVAYARRLDEQDELARFRTLFEAPAGSIYLDGNSLGLACHPAVEALEKTLAEWRRMGVGGWMGGAPPWFFLAEELAGAMAPLMGAAPDEIAVANSTTVNLHQLLGTLFAPAPGRDRILIDALSFPSDAYAIESHLRLRGLDPETHLVRVSSADGLTLDEEAIIAAFSGPIHTAVLPMVVYTSGQLLGGDRIAAAARERGVLIGFDCSHSAGVVPHCLDEWQVDFAVWCGYKYLNGGPGAGAGLYLNRRHFGRSPGLAGWWGSRKDRQLDMPERLDPAEGAGALQIGTPNILSLAPLRGALRLITEAGIERIRRKSLSLTGYLMALSEALLAEYGFVVVTPREERRRGGHVALRHPEAARLCQALKDCGVVTDYRRPGIVRLAPVALYTSYTDCLDAVHRLRGILRERRYERYPSVRPLIP